LNCGVTLVGRAAELHQVERFLSDADDALLAVLIEGEAGSGKTAVMSVVIERPHTRLLRCQGAEAEAGYGYSGLADLLGGLVEDGLAGLPGPQRCALEVALLLADPGAERQVEPHTVGRAVLSALTVLCERDRLVLAVDDVHWLDRPTRRALTFALRRITAPVAVIATARGVGTRFPFALEAALPVDRLLRLSLGPMPAQDIDRLLQVRRPAASREARRRARAAARGNPMFALELVDAHDLPGAAVPQRVEELLPARLDRLPQLATAALAAVGLLPDATRELVRAACGVDVTEALDAAVDAAILVEQDGHVRFSHPLYGYAARQRLLVAERRALHRRLSEVIDDPEQRARHLSLAVVEPDLAVADLVERGARVARARGAPESAADLEEAAIRLTPLEAAELWVRRLVEAGYHRAMSGETATSRRHFETALRCPVPASQLADLRWRYAMICFLDGDLDRCVAELEQARADVAGDRALEGLILARLAGMTGRQGDLRRSVRFADLAMATWDDLDPFERQRVLATHAIDAFLAAEPDSRERLGAVDAALDTAQPSGPHEDIEGILFLPRLALQGPGTTMTALARMMQACDDAGDEIGLGWSASFLSQAALAAGDWRRAADAAAEAVRVADRVRSPTVSVPARATAALVQALTDAPDRVRADVEAAAQLAESTGIFLLDRIDTRNALGLVALSAGDAATAHGYFASAHDMARGAGINEPTVGYFRWYDLDALIELGRFDEAQQLADKLGSRGTQLGRPLATALAHTALGSVRAAGQDHAAAFVELDTAMAAHAVLGWPFERARTQLAYGTVLRRAKQKGAARARLEDGLQVFRRLGAGYWAARTAAQLARIGGRAPAGDALSEGERRVAELAAEGLTNQQIADRLFLTTKTVAAHLTRTYVKLGVRSRTELAAKFRANSGSSSDSLNSARS